MGRSNNRIAFKRILPRPLRALAGQAVTYSCRVRTWRAVMRQLSGATAADQAVLKRSYLRGLVRAFRDLDRWQDPQLIAAVKVDVPGIGRFSVRPYSDDLYQILPSQEAAVLAEIRSRLRPGSTFIDAGANIGFYSVVASGIVGPAGRVLAFEMMPDTAAQLRENLSENAAANVAIFEHALSDRSGDKVLASIPVEKFGRASIVFDDDDEAPRKIAVSTRRLDDLIADERGAIDLMKIDIEGAEAMALRGAKEALSRTHAVIFERLKGNVEAAELLQQEGFKVRMLDATNALAERV